MEAKISEIFSSIQGEGIYTGMEQVFVRFYGCNLNCDFCDTRIDDYTLLSLDDVVKEVEDLYSNHHSVSLTGGEPLLQIEFLQELLPLLKEKDFLLYLETNGTLPEQFGEVKDLVDIVAMDIKLPTSCKCGENWKQHEEFLSEAIDSNADLFVKSVVSSSTKIKDIEKTAELIAYYDKDIPLILQPNFNDKDLEEKLSEFKDRALQKITDARIMRQEHKYLGVK